MSKYGEIPTEILIGKFEQTCVHEDEDLTNFYQRDLLKDQRPDTPFLASDAPRDLGSYSKGLIEARTSGTGSRSGATPDMPDLFLEHTDPDPRGAQVDPDMMKLREHSYHRRHILKHSFKNDEDLGVPSQGRNPYKVDADKRATFHGMKNRLKIFETSLDNRPHGMPLAQNYSENVRRHDMNALEKAGIYDDISDGEVHAGKTTKLSNLTEVGYRSTPDHRFKVAKYGRVLSGRSQIKQINANKNGIKDGRDMKMFEDQFVPRSVIMGMKWAMREKVRYDNKFGTARDTRVFKWAKYFPSRPLRRALMTQKTPMQERLQVLMMSKGLTPGKGNARETAVDHRIVRMMEMATRGGKNPGIQVDHNKKEKAIETRRIRKELGEMVRKGQLMQNYFETARNGEFSSRDRKLFSEMIRKIAAPVTDNDKKAKMMFSERAKRAFNDPVYRQNLPLFKGLEKNSSDVSLRHQGRGVAVYSGKVPEVNKIGANHMAWDADAGEVWNAGVYSQRGAIGQQATHLAHIQSDNKFLDAGSLSRHLGSMGQKYKVARYTESDNTSESINDSGSTLRSAIGNST